MREEIFIPAVIATVIVLFLGGIVGADTFTKIKRQECVQTLKDRPAIEIAMVCK